MDFVITLGDILGLIGAGIALIAIVVFFVISKVLEAADIRAKRRAIEERYRKKEPDK